MAKAQLRTIELKATNNGSSIEIPPPSKKDELTFHNKMKGDYFFVTFTLKDETDQKLRFKPNFADALWVQPLDRTAPCPSQACAMAVFEPLYLSPDGTELTVVNLNDAEQDLGFVLNFESAINPNVTATCDPIVTNKNGGAAAPNSNFLLLAGAIAAGVAAVAAIVWLNR